MAEEQNFFARWSRRKASAQPGRSTLAADEGAAVAPITGAKASVHAGPTADATVAAAGVAPTASMHASAAAAVASRQAAGSVASGDLHPAVLAEPQAGPSDGTAATADGTGPRPAPTLADVARLTHDADYSRFVATSVAPDVRNAALKKLFSDPHFNVMDGLDTYIGDYNTPDPLPEGWLRKMVQSDLLGLFSDEADAGKPMPAAVADAADADTAPLPPALAGIDPPPPFLVADPLLAPDEDTDLQLQPDDGARRAGADTGAGPDAAGPH